MEIDNKEIIKDYVEKKAKAKHWRTKDRVVKFHPKWGDPKTQFLACIDPNSYKLIRVFTSIANMEYDTNSRNLQMKLYRYFRDHEGKGALTICNYIVVAFKEEDMENVSLEQFHKHIKDLALNKILLIQTRRIIENLEVFTTKDKNRIFKLMEAIEHPGTKLDDYEIEM